MTNSTMNIKDENGAEESMSMLIEGLNTQNMAEKIQTLSPELINMEMEQQNTVPTPKKESVEQSTMRNVSHNSRVNFAQY